MERNQILSPPFRKSVVGQWWCSPLIPAIGRGRDRWIYRFEYSLVYKKVCCIWSNSGIVLVIQNSWKYGFSPFIQQLQ